MATRNIDDVKKVVGADVPVEKPVRKPRVKKEATVEEVYVETSSYQTMVEDIKRNVRASYESAGGNLKDIKTLRIYLNTDERKAYYVVNGEAAGTAIEF